MNGEWATKRCAGHGGTGSACADCVDAAIAAAPASPDDLARVADAGDALYDSLANDKCWCGPTVKCRRCKKLSEWETARVLLARLTPPTGTAAGNAGETRTKESKP